MRIVPALDEVEDREPGFALILEPARNEQLAFQRCIEALAHRVVEAITDRAHRRPNPGFLATLAKCDRRVLAT